MREEKLIAYAQKNKPWNYATVNSTSVLSVKLHDPLAWQAWIHQKEDNTLFYMLNIDLISTTTKYVYTVFKYNVWITESRRACGNLYHFKPQDDDTVVVH